jgi:hypothetical protein
VIDKIITSFNKFIRPEFASIKEIDLDTLEKEEEAEKKKERFDSNS